MLSRRVCASGSSVLVSTDGIDPKTQHIEEAPKCTPTIPDLHRVWIVLSVQCLEFDAFVNQFSGGAVTSTETRCFFRIEKETGSLSHW